jgi:predicted nucleic acid-binding protein
LHENYIEHRRSIDPPSLRTDRGQRKNFSSKDGSGITYRPGKREAAGKIGRNRKVLETNSEKKTSLMNMVLVDTSVWINHFQRGVPHFSNLLNDGKVTCHPFIIGELACGRFNKRNEILNLLKALPSCLCIEHNEILQYTERLELCGIGIGYVDAHLLISSRLFDLRLWTMDKRLEQAALELSLSYE